MTTPTVNSIPKDMPRTGEPIHPIDGWEAVNSTMPELGVLRISHVPGSTQIGLFIRMEAIMFPLAYFKNWHCAHRFASWMEGNKEPEPTLAQEWNRIMEAKMKEVEEAPGIEGTIRSGTMTFNVTAEPVIPTPGLPKWPKEKEGEEDRVMHQAPIPDALVKPKGRGKRKK